MEIYKNAFIRSLTEDMTAASALYPNSATAGTFGGAVGNHDSYAPGDARIPHALGSKKQKKKKKGKKKLPKVPPESVPFVHTRFSGMTGPSGKAGFGIF